MTDKSLTRRHRSLIQGKTPEEKLWYGVSKLSGQGRDGDCWEWQYSKRGSGDRVGGGYGYFTLRGTKYSTHRFAYELTKGEIPEGLKILHSCDNPPCCNPQHLSLGTDQDNVLDMFAKGRGGIGESHWTKHKPECLARGEKQHSAKMTPEKVRAMRQRWDAGGATSRELAKEFGIKQSSAHKICARKSWKHIE